MATGIAMVDEQHQQLLEIFNRAAQAHAERAPPAHARALLEALVEYTGYHFREEERLMLASAVDPRHRAMHLRAHRSFRRFLRQAQTLAQEHAADVIVELLAFLAQWLLNHILEVDRQLAHELSRSDAAPSAVPADPLEQALGVRRHLVEAVSEVTEHLGHRTLELLSQRQQLLDLQGLYQALLHCGDVLIQCRHEQEMLESLCAKLTLDTPFHAAWIGRPGHDGVFDVLALAGEGVGQVRCAPPRLCESDTASVVVKAWRTQRLLVCNDTLADPTLQPWHEGFGAHRWLSLLAIPILRNQRLWAILALAAPRRAGFAAATIEVCTRIGALLGRGLDELDLKERIRTLQAQEARMARTDTLTGLPNRLALEEYLPQAIARARRRGHSLAVGVIDLDDFKPVNDRLGHDAGDELLRTLAHRLREFARSADFIARLGGDEFVVVLEDLQSGQEAPQLSGALARLHHAVEAPFQPLAGTMCSVDMTMGLALYPADGDEAEQLLRRADAAMYQAKQSKQGRAQWWQLGVTAALEPLAEQSFDPFGAEARECLQVLGPHLARVAEEFSTAFYRELHSHRETAAILTCLSAEELQGLAGKQTTHLRFLLDAQTSAQQLQEAARRLGTAHALIGVSGAWMALAMGVYRDLLRQHLDAVLLTARTRYRALQAAEARLQMDIESELQAMQSVLDQYQTMLARPMDGRALAADWTQTELNALAALPGMRAAVLFRPDTENRLLIERAAGEAADTMSEAFRTRALHPLLDPRDARGQGLVATTWMTDCAQEASAVAHDPRVQPWQAVLQECRIRSAVTIPVHRHGTIHAVLMLYGAYPHQFSSGWTHPWRLSLQNRWSQMTRASHNHALVIDTRQVEQIRSLLYGGAVQMWVQPIVDLRDGTLVKVEALARLRTHEGAWLSPGQFLPALGESDLDALLRQGLRLSLAHLRGWREAQLPTALSINLAPSSLVHPDCARWVEEALREAQVAPEHLTLELLESQTLEAAAIDAAIGRLAALGVRIAMDDLGSGFSNLKRLADLPFDVIKVDQNIIKDLARDPVKALSLIRTVVQIGEDLERDVVAEGLEDAAIIEAAIVLGCRFGQGYALGRPMPPEALAQWLEQRPFRGGAGRPLTSWLGALAYQWRLMHDPLHVQQPGPLADCPISHFLQAQQVHDEQILWLHACIHEHPAETERRQAMRQLLAWFAGKTRSTCTEAGN